MHHCKCLLKFAIMHEQILIQLLSQFFNIFLLEVVFSTNSRSRMNIKTSQHLFFVEFCSEAELILQQMQSEKHMQIAKEQFSIDDFIFLNLKLPIAFYIQITISKKCFLHTFKIMLHKKQMWLSHANSFGTQKLILQFPNELFNFRSNACTMKKWHCTVCQLKNLNTWQMIFCDFCLIQTKQPCFFNIPNVTASFLLPNCLHWCLTWNKVWWHACPVYLIGSQSNIHKSWKILM